MQSCAELTSTASKPQLDLSGSVLLVALCVNVNSVLKTPKWMTCVWTHNFTQLDPKTSFIQMLWGNEEPWQFGVWCSCRWVNFSRSHSGPEQRASCMSLSPTTTHSHYLFYLTLTASLDFYCSPGVIKYINLTKSKWLQNQLQGTFYMLQFDATTPTHVAFHAGSCAPEQGILANYKHCRGFSDQKSCSVAKAVVRVRVGA